jgi:hypothetical protein
MGEWRKLHNEELHNLYSSPDIIRQVKSRRMRWAGHVACVGEDRKVYEVLMGKPEGKKPLGRWDQKGSWGDWLGGCGLDSTSSGQGPVAGCCECGDESLGSCTTELVSFNEMRKIETNTINMITVNSQLHKIKIASGEQVTEPFMSTFLKLKGLEHIILLLSYTVVKCGLFPK